MKLDIDFVRSHFTQLHDDPAFVFTANAGGSYVCDQVNQAVEHYNRHTRVQPYNRYRSSAEAGDAMDRAHHGWAAALNVDPAELTFGPSTSMNTFVMSHAFGDNWSEGDEIIVTDQDHEANIGAWRRMAKQKQVAVREWRVDSGTGLLDPESLNPLLNARTKWVFFSHCSNVVGTVNPVAEIVREVRARSDARVFVDAVAYAPHHIPDLKALGVDGYVFSLYKVFGPHQGLLYLDGGAGKEAASQAHFFNRGNPTKDFNPAGPQHAQIAGCAGVLDYFSDLHRHHFGDTRKSSSDTLADVRQLFLQHENELAAPILGFLSDRSDIRLLGKSTTADNDRAPTIAFKPLRGTSASVTKALQAAGIGAEHGNFYAHRLVTNLGIEPADGVVRLSLVHYNNQPEVSRIVTALESVLG